MRLINPPQRFQTLQFRTDDVTPGASSIEFLFQSDVVIHSVFAQVSFICPTATFASVSFNFSGPNQGTFGDNQKMDAVMAFSHANLHATVPSLLAQYQNTIPIGQMLLGSGSKFFVSRITNQSAGQTSSIVGNVSIAFNPLSEWVNFREPRTGVRL